MDYHRPVLLTEVLDYLRIAPGEKYIDSTLGDGGHTVAILKRGGHVLGIDYSEESLGRAKDRIESLGLSENFVGVLGNFKDVEEIAKEHAFIDVSGFLLDLGYSSSQLDQDEAGLSFQKEAPLDMRLDKSLGVTAADLLNTLSQKQLEQILFEFGEESMGRRFAQAIVEKRELKKFQTTKDLTDLIVAETPSGYAYGKRHPATKTYQALRIVVNDELNNLRNALPQAARLLKLPGGRMLVISFHSLEDRLVKQFGRSVRPRVKDIAKGPIAPTFEEVSLNVRSRSAKMRVFERV